MRHPLGILATFTMLAAAAPVLAEIATDTAATATPATRHAGAYNALSDGDRKIVSAIYEAQLGSANDTAGGSLLSRDDIAALRQTTGWGNAYQRLHQQGMVADKNLGQAISSYNRSVHANRAITVINTGGGEQLAFSKDKSNNAAPPSAKPGAGKSATAKPAPRKPVVVTTAEAATAADSPAGATRGVILSTTTQSPAGGATRASVTGNGQSGGIVLK